MYFIILKRNLPGSRPIFLYADDTHGTGTLAAVQISGGFQRALRFTLVNEADAALSVGTLIVAGYNSIEIGRASCRERV